MPEEIKPVVATPAPTPAPAAEPKKTTYLERLRGAVDEPPAGSKLLATLNSNQPPPRTRLVEPEPAPAAPAPTPTPEPAPAVPEPAKPAPAAAPKRPKKEDVVDRVARTVDKLANTVGKMAAAREPVAAPAPEVKLSPKQERTIALMAELEHLHPTHYEPGFAEKVRAMIPEVAKFEQTFKDKNPNASDEELDDAISKFEHSQGIAVDEEHLEEAKDSVKSRPLMERLEQQERTIQKLMQGEHQRQTKPQLQRSAAEAAAEVAKGFGDDYTKLVGRDGNVDETALQTFMEKAADPITAEFAVDAIRSASSFAAAISSVRLNQDHKQGGAARAFIKSVEDRYIHSIGRQDEEGRQLIRESEIDSLPPKEINALLTGNHPDKFIIPESDIISLASEEIASLAKQDIDRDKARIQRIAPRLGLKPEPAAPRLAPKPASPTASDAVQAPLASTAPQPTGYGSWKDRLKNGTPKTRMTLSGLRG